MFASGFRMNESPRSNERCAEMSAATRLVVASVGGPAGFIADGWKPTAMSMSPPPSPAVLTTVGSGLVASGCPLYAGFVMLPFASMYAVAAWRNGSNVGLFGFRSKRQRSLPPGTPRIEPTYALPVWSTRMLGSEPVVVPLPYSVRDLLNLSFVFAPQT